MIFLILAAMLGGAIGAIGLLYYLVNRFNQRRWF